jgi:hypothetical protein
MPPTPLDLAVRNGAVRAAEPRTQDTEGSGTRQPRRRIRPQSERRCKRESCGRQRKTGSPFCSALCHQVVFEMEKTEAVCRDLGPGTESSELWLAAVSLGDALTEYRLRSTRARRRGYRAQAGR